jgi:hypothetical protein
MNNKIRGQFTDSFYCKMIFCEPSLCFMCCFVILSDFIHFHVDSGKPKLADRYLMGLHHQPNIGRVEFLHDIVGSVDKSFQGPLLDNYNYRPISDKNVRLQFTATG